MPSTLQDQDQRDLITTSLDRNLVVLAGAGAGKTHALIDRMVSAIRAGHAEIDRMAAITFTRKAAGEMKGRFYLNLRMAAVHASGSEARRLQQALERIDHCFTGTIHSFCGRLLQERPVEASLTPDFTEVEEREEAVLRRESWDRFVQERFIHEDPLLENLAQLGLYPEDLFSFFERRCTFSDVPLKKTETERPDLQPAVDRLLFLLEDIALHIPVIPNGERDKCMETVLRARHFVDHHGIEGDEDRIYLLKLFESNPNVTLKLWEPHQAYAKKLRDELIPSFRNTVLQPILQVWRQYVYRHVASFIDAAMAFYDDERHRSGRLTFQDLLLKATRLLRDHPHVRSFFSRRFTCLFVDEFQDTDPVQAEMLFHLAGTDTGEKDWRRLIPRPGSLFLVGDEKQSIYRFRRADVDTFRLARQVIEETGGAVVRLNTSFRSLGNLCGWINTAFPVLFNSHLTRYQAEFAPLLKFQTDGLDTHCVRRLTTPSVPRHKRAEIAVQEAIRIGDFIAAAIAGKTEFNGEEEGSLLDTRAKPGDFMILTRTTKLLADYARALEERGIPYDIVGGGRLGSALEVRSIVELLEAVYAPESTMALLAYLRGPLVGLGDDELYAFHQSGGRFSYRLSRPEGLAQPLAERIDQAFDRLRRAEHMLTTLTPPAALDRILEDVGLVPFASTLPVGSSRAGNLLRILALVRKWSSQGMHWGEILHELRDLIRDPAYKMEEMTLESGSEDVVQLMNLHQAKGLQARVVILADAMDTSNSRFDPDFHVSRLGSTPFLSMPVRKLKGSFHWETIAEPAGWDEDLSEEACYQSAEELRLLYVAATRAQRLLVVCCYEGKLDQGPWSPLRNALKDIPELPEFSAPLVSTSSEVLPDLDDLRRKRAIQWREIRNKSYVFQTVTGEASKVQIQRETPGLGKDYGTLIHRLFEDAVRQHLPGNERAYIGALIQEIGLVPALVEQAHHALNAFRRSEIWQEIGESQEVHTEVPFATRIQENGAMTLLRGTIDLIYRAPSGWKIVDYKTNAFSDEAEKQALMEHFAPQLGAYAKWWETITGEMVTATCIYMAGECTFPTILQSSFIPQSR